MKQECCYYQCHEEGNVNIGPNRGDSHWMVFGHRDNWNKPRPLPHCGSSLLWTNWENCCAKSAGRRSRKTTGTVNRGNCHV